MLAKLHVGMNPIVVKELRSRMRDSRAFITLTAALLVLGGSSYLLYRIVTASMAYSNMPLSPQVGQSLFVALAFLELMMVSAIAPAVTAGAISSEKEKLTYEMLLTTPLTPGSILWGKLVSALSYVFLLIFAAIPMASLIFIFGGVTLRDMFKALIILVVVAITLGMLGMFMSAWLGRTSRATVVSYLTVAALYVIPLIAYLSVGILRQAEPPRALLVASPISALFSAVTPPTAGYGYGSFFWSIGLGLGGNLGVLSGATISQTSIPRPLYHYSLPIYGMITVALYLLSTRLVLPTRRWRMRRRDILIGSGLILLVVGATGLVFFATSGRYEQASIFSMVEPVPPRGGPIMREQVAVERAVPVAPEIAPDMEEKNVAPPPGEGPVDQDENDRAIEIYAAIVQRIYTVDHLGADNRPPSFQKIYLVNLTDDTAGDPNAPFEDPAGIPEKVQEGIAAALLSSEDAAGQNLPTDIAWIEAFDENNPPWDDSDPLEAIYIKFGNIHDQDEGEAYVSAAQYSTIGSMGKTYILSRVDGSWQVTGDTAFQWNR